ncbi:MAG: lysophospholipid acyltransferase family protein [Chloroflexota bacterium]
MNFVRWFVIQIIKLGLGISCRIDSRDLERIPQKGSLIVYSNHTGSIEIPLIFVLLQPRPVTGIAKIETWDNAFMAWLFNLWEIIPIRRGEADMDAMRKALDSLRDGKILGMSPEGTRNKTGKLLPGHPGIVMLAIRSGAPLIPLAHWGGENFKSNVQKFQRTIFHVRVGNPFVIRTDEGKLNKKTRQVIVDELMYQLAALLPDEYRGEYSDLTKATTDYLLFSENY